MTQSLAQSYLGPVLNGQVVRDNPKPFSTNDTHAVVPTRLIHQREDYPELPVHQIMLRPPVDQALLVSLKEEIQDHFEGRIANFLIQSVMVYGTGLHFIFNDAADDQYGKPGTYSKVPKGLPKASRGYAAAHMATLPTLVVQGAQKVHIFGKGSFFHKQANATTWLPVVCNQVDSDFDLKIKCEGQTFREMATTVLNLLASNECEPSYAFDYFLENSVTFLNRSNKQGLEKQVVGYYQDVATDYLRQVNKSDLLVKTLLGYRRDPDSLAHIYKKAQREVHTLFMREMQALAPVYIPSPQLEQRLKLRSSHPARFRIYLDGYMEGVKVTKTMQKYIDKAMGDRNAHQKVLIYLVNVKDEQELSTHLHTAVQAPPPRNYTNGLPNHFVDLYTEVRRTSGLKSEPRSLHEIVAGVLQATTHNPMGT